MVILIATRNISRQRKTFLSCDLLGRMGQRKKKKKEYKEYFHVLSFYFRHKVVLDVMFLLSSLHNLIKGKNMIHILNVL